MYKTNKKDNILFDKICQIKFPCYYFYNIVADIVK